MQQSKHGQHRFGVLMKEMRESSSDEEYLASIMAFVNCVLKGASDLMKRIRLRNEFLGKMVYINCASWICVQLPYLLDQTPPSISRHSRIEAAPPDTPKEQWLLSNSSHGTSKLLQFCS